MEPVCSGWINRICFPSKAPKQLGNFEFISNILDISYHFSCDGSLITMGLNIFQIVSQTCGIIVATVDLPIL